MDELQALWRKASVQETESVSHSELEAVISRRSSDELAKFRQVIKSEYMLIWPALLATIAGGVWLSNYLIATAPLAVLFGYMIYFYRRSLKQFDDIHYEDDLKTYLQRALRFLKSYVRHYKIICWASGFVGVLVGYLAAKNESDSSSDLNILVDTYPTAFLIGTTVFVVCCLLGIHFYIKHLYQARINAMENLLEEFAEN
ncbi:MAG: hypothetical protein AAF223_11665 [Bacteroidota bacterium]